MLRGIAVVACVVACYAPRAQEGAPCGTNGECPTGLSCRDGVCLRGAATDATDIIDDDAGMLDDASVDAAIDAPIDAATCPAGYATIAGQTSMYRTVLTQKTWLVAEQDCEDDGTGTHLVVIETAAEDTAVDALTGASIWFGLSDRVTVATPRWVTTALPGYTNYGGPGNTGAYDCSGIYQSKWAWGDCGTLIEYVCECDGVPASQSAY